MGTSTAADRRSQRQLFDDTFAIDPGPTKRYLLHNRTPRQIRIIDDRYGEVVLPPLAQRVIAGARLAPFADQLRLLRQRHQLRVRDYSRPRPHSRLTVL